LGGIVQRRCLRFAFFRAELLMMGAYCQNKMFFLREQSKRPASLLLSSMADKLINAQVWLFYA